jgi:hypothetical protein
MQCVMSCHAMPCHAMPKTPFKKIPKCNKQQAACNREKDKINMLESIVMWALRTTSSNDLDLDCQSAQVPPVFFSFFEGMGMGETCFFYGRSV